MAKTGLIPIQYYTAGPRPFSGSALSYWDIYIIQLMVRLRTACLDVGLAMPAFEKFWLLFNRSEEKFSYHKALITDYTQGTPATPSPISHTDVYTGLEKMPYVWSAELTYGVDDLEEVHRHGVVTASPPGGPTTWEVSEPIAGDLIGQGKTFGGNFIAQISDAFGDLLTDQDKLWDWYWASFKEFGPFGAYGSPAPGTLPEYWYIFGEKSNYYPALDYNLVTDHVELLRLWPRSLVNLVGTSGGAFQTDGRLEDRSGSIPSYLGYNKLAIRAIDPINNGSGTIPATDLKAVVEFDDGQVYIRDSGVHINDALGYQAFPAGGSPLVDGCIGGTHENCLLVWTSSGTVIVFERTGADAFPWVRRGTFPVYYVTNELTLDGSDPVPVWDTVQLAGAAVESIFGDSQTWGEGWRVYNGRGDPANYEDWDNYLGLSIPSIGRIVVVGYRQVDVDTWRFEACGTLATPFTPGGLCGEQTDGHGKEGPPWAWRLLLNEHRGTRIVAADFGGPLIAEARNLGRYADDLYLQVKPLSIFDRTGRDATNVFPVPPNLVFDLPWPYAYNNWDILRTELEQHGGRTYYHMLVASPDGAYPGGYTPNGIVEGSYQTPTHQLVHIYWAFPVPSEMDGLPYYYEESTGYHHYRCSDPGYVDCTLAIEVEEAYDANNVGGSPSDLHDHNYAFSYVASTIKSGGLKFIILAHYFGDQDVSNDDRDIVRVYYDNTYVTTLPGTSDIYSCIQTTLGWLVTGVDNHIYTGSTLSDRFDEYDVPGGPGNFTNWPRMLNPHLIEGTLVSGWVRNSNLFCVMGIVQPTPGDYTWGTSGGWGIPCMSNDDQSIAWQGMRYQ